MSSKKENSLTENGNAKLKVLVVENNPVLLRAVSTILKQESCTVKTAATGLEALEIVDEFCPDIVFTDLIMPMVNGEQLCRILRNIKKHEDVFIVVLSAIIIEDRERILREVQCDLCIAKGNLQEIRESIKEVLEVFNQRHISVSWDSNKDARIPTGLQPSEVTSELLLEKHHFADILSNLNEGIVELNHQGKVVAVNNAALNILSCREEQMIGLSLAEAVSWGDFQDAVEQWTHQELVCSGLKKYDIFEDDPLHLNNKIVTASFIPIANDGYTYGLCILHDITRQFTAEKHQREMDNALKLVKKMEDMSSMAGGLSHDFNNLLTVICGNLDILTLKNATYKKDEQDKMLEEAKKAALVAVDLTRQISCFSNFGIINREQIIFEDLVTKTVESFFGKGGNSYKVVCNCKKSCIHGDPEGLELAITNLLKNAVEASSGNEVEIHILETEYSSPQLMAGQYVPAGRYIRTDIADSGHGIKREHLFRIFDPYFSTKERGSVKGMGLGLTVVYAILRNHGGYVVVNSTSEQGTIVSLYLPALGSLHGHKSSEEEAGKKEGFVLLMEPEKQMGEIGKIMLEYLGFSVSLLVDRKGVLDELQKFADYSVPHRPLIIIALSKENRESAAETCRLLHEIDPDVQVIAMSGSILDPVMVEYHKYGFVNSIPKPFSMATLKHITSTVLQK